MYKMSVIVLFLQLFCCSALPSHVRSDASANFGFGNLRGEADFRAVTLRWESIVSIGVPIHFLVSSCEIQPTASTKCKTQEAGQPEDLTGSVEPMARHRNWSSTVTDLRLATNYTFQVTPFHLATSKQIFPSRTINVHTKGFSAVTEECLGRYSRVRVETGPFFGGRISVENSKDARCYLDGDQQSSRTSYELVIDHEQCNSATNESSVISTIIVQEKPFVLTHSTKRFVVICHYQPGNVIVHSSFHKSVALANGTVDSSFETEERLQDLAAENLVHVDQNYTSIGSLTSRSEQNEASTTGLILSISSFSAIVVFAALVASASFHVRNKCKRNSIVTC